MTAEEVARIQARIIGIVRNARSGVEALQAQIDGIMSNTARLTPEARRSDAAELLAPGRTRIMGMLREEARGVLAGAFAAVDNTLGRLTAVGDEDLAAADRSLRPVLNAAMGRPEVLLNLYRERHLSPADRRLIEGTAAAVIDGLGGLDNYAFRDEWNALQQELMAARGPEELEALSRRSVLEGLEGYLDAAERLVGIDLALMDPSFNGDRDDLAVRRSMAEAEVNRYENENAAGMAA